MSSTISKDVANVRRSSRKASENASDKLKQMASRPAAAPKKPKDPNAPPSKRGRKAKPKDESSKPVKKPKKTVSPPTEDQAEAPVEE